MPQPLVQSIPHPPATDPIPPDDARLQRLEKLFGIRFSVVDVQDFSVLHAADDIPPGDWEVRAMICREVANRRQAAVIDEVGPLLVLAIPILDEKTVRFVAVAGFVTTESYGGDQQETTDTGRDDRNCWLQRQPRWPEPSLLATANLFVEREALAQRAVMLEAHVDGLSENLSHTYEEISLLHRIAGHLKISDGVTEVAHVAVDWLQDVLATEAVVAYFEPQDSADQTSSSLVARSGMLVKGRCPLNEQTMRQLIAEIGLEAVPSVKVLNHPVTKQDRWPFPEISELVIVPLRAGDQCLGYLAAVNHSDGRDFGTVEASLLNSVATMLAIHYGNTELFQAQINLFSGMVQSLVSAIDAKDPYTCGHSDRVARVSRRLAQHLGCDEEMLNTIYLSGLLHDIGKIGIDDNVLRKPGKLTEEEFEHIKQHPELGYNILKDIRQIKDALPGVLYHHESWDGSGYPMGLAGHEIPFLARILAVADAFDAMSSDRSYRKGMPDEELDQILRDGAGQQWDADVVKAFFEIRDEIREIANREREHIQLDALAWS
ncbi:MAG: HD domain-containing protein [Planctomycetales bacterium]|nr:HD domain-containing protein [Planctomycetales bacterium]NIM10037.1 HD domain-containing protein [Planctomycetales bacterium]NIN09478.1 HD domain-containing protein [Planctomycetales bacterium]NIN78586.1 HD domain-containing protein [Planctomycetales bacterium]NIO35780.1 HD domain-containing protein [Planctomycetales bacterium]